MEAGLKTPIIGRTEQQIQDAQDAADNAVRSLEQRYANPNWFNVAAGFLKPQLGGFAASLGSAAQELGNWQEQQRSNEIPLYAARAQLGAYTGQLKNRQSAAKAFEEAQKANFPPEQLPGLQARLTSLGAEDLAGSVGKMIDTQQKDRDLFAKEQAAALQRIALAKITPGMTPNPADLALVSGGPLPPRGGAAGPAGAAGAADASSVLKPEVTPAPLNPLGAVTPEGQPATWTGGVISPEDYDALVEKTQNKDNPKVAEEARNILKAYEATLRGGKKAVPAALITAAPAPKAPTPNPLTIEQQAAINKENAEELKTMYQPVITSIIQHNRQNFTDTKELLKSTITYINDPEVAKGLGQLYASQGWLAAAQQALAKGIQISASGGVLGGNFSASIPVEDILKSLKLSPEVQKKIRQVNINLAQLEAKNIRESLAGVGAGGHANVPEFNTAMSRIVSGSDPQEVLRPYLAKETVKNMRGHEHHNAFNTWRKTNPNVPNYEYVGTEGYNAIADKYAPDLAKAYGN
jgi:hypothetical protein